MQYWQVLVNKQVNIYAFNTKMLFDTIIHKRAKMYKFKIFVLL